MTQRFCPGCRRIVFGTHDCTSPAAQPPGAVSAEKQWLESVRNVCNGSCPHFRGDSGSHGCALLKSPCELYLHVHQGKSCPDGRFPDRPRISRPTNVTVTEKRQSEWEWVARSKCNQSCEHWGNINGSIGCTLLPVVRDQPPNKPCDIGYHIRKGRGCFADPPRFGPLYHEFPEFNWPCKGGKRVLCTIIIGELAQQCAEYTLPRIQRYAKKIDAELVIVDRDIYPQWPMANKFFIGSVASQYDRTFYCDIDVWIRDSCPNVFETFPAGSIYKHRDQDHLEHGHLERDAQILGHPGKVQNCWNSGVAILDRKHADIWTPPQRVCEFTHTLEQSTAELNIVLKGYRITPLPPAFNNQLWTGEAFSKNYATAHIIHLSGWRHKRIEHLERLKAEEGI